MEAAPRLPMLSFDLKVSPDFVQFAPKLMPYIAAFYNEDPESYVTEISNLEGLRNSAVRPSMDVTGVQLLKKYYCQLHFLKSRFPMEDGQEAAVRFPWKDPQLDLSYTSNDIRYELMVIMYNIGALHTYLGANDSRSNPDGMKLACTHFQCAAWAFQTVKEKYHQFIMYVSVVELVHFFQQVCLAQAQECILEKSMLDNRKATIIAKVAVQVHSYYRQSLSILEYASEDMFRDKTYKEWTKYLQFKMAYYKCVALLFQGQQAEEQQKMGERVAFYQAASEQLEEAKKWATALKNRQPEINEGLAFTQDVVEGKRKAAKNENEFIYHEEVPSKDQLQEVKGASLVKGISFSINDPEVSGPDLFARLVPMEAHEAASLYSEKKAQMLRNIGELIENKDQALAELMSSMQLDMLTKMHQATGIPQEIIDRAAALSAKPSATQDLIDAMGKLSNIYQEVESSLKEIDTLLKEEEDAEKGYQEIMGKRPPSIIATDLARESAKYKEAHTKANDSNQTLHRAMTAHVANLKILQQPLRQLQQQLPSVELPNANVDENALKDLETLVAKVEEMRNQRAMLWAQLRESVHKDDITNSLVTKQPNQSLDQLFQQELQKHQHLTNLIEQNAVAQENIKKALVESYAQAVNTRRYIQDIIQKRSSTISALVASCDSYDDLLAKANKGIEFYTKLETNVSKLLQRIKSACKVQQEEREHMLLKNEVPKVDDSLVPAAPKLKDYLESRRKNPNPTTYPDPSLQYQPQTINYGMNPTMELPPGIRPAPLGSEFTDVPKNSSNEPYTSNLQYNYGQAQLASHGYQYQQPAVGNVTPNVDQDLASRMNALLSISKADTSGTQYTPQYSYSSYIPQNYTPTTYASSQPFTSVSQTDLNTSYDTNKAYTTTVNSYRPLSSSTLPNNTTTHMQYSDASLGQPASDPPANYQYPSYSSVGYSQPTQTTTQSTVHNVNTYYPTGYGPNYGTPTQTAPQNLPGQVQYHSLEYITSVPMNLANNSHNSTYSSPVPNMASAQASDPHYMAMNVGYLVGATSSTAHDSTSTFSYHTTTSQSFPAYPTGSVLQSGTTSHPTSTLPTNTTSSYVTGNNTYATGNTSYPTGGASYPADNASYATGNVPYQTGHVTYQTGNASYPTGNASYSTGNASYPASSTSYVPPETKQTVPSSQTYYGTYSAGGTYATNSGTSLPQQGGGSQGSAAYETYATNRGTSVPQHGTQNVGYETYPPSSGTPVQHHDSGNQNVTGPSYGTYASYYNQTYGQAYSAGYDYGISGTVQPQTPHPGAAALPIVAKESNIDLLSGLDFTISQAPLVPQQNVPQKSQEKEEKKSEESKVTVVKQESKAKEETVSVPEVKPSLVKILPSKPLNNSDVKNLFNMEVDKYEKYVETLTSKTLSGPTNLDIKWKEIQDKQDSDAQRKIISVARCYPMKNRYPDILPYDHSRIELQGTKDDYINASLVKEVSVYAPPFIVTQAPLSSTIGDFWTMIREQQVELIFCLLNDSEIGDDAYWPKEKGENLNFLNMVLSLQSMVVKSHWVERLISLNLPEKRESWVVMHLQFTSWPGSLFPTTPDPFVSYVLELISLYQQQRCNTHPVVVHCSSGIGRSGIACLLTAAIYDVTNNANSVPDLAVLTSKLTNCRKNVLRDREHLKFAYECFLAYMKQVLNQDKMKKKLNEVVPKPETEAKHLVEVVETNIDPLSTLDPFWASKNEIEAQHLIEVVELLIL